MIEQQEVFEWGRIQSASDWLWFVLPMLLFLAAVGWLYRRDTRELRPSLRSLLLALRWGGYALLFWVFLDPRTRLDTRIERPSRVLVLVDCSLSMTEDDRSANPTSVLDQQPNDAEPTASEAELATDSTKPRPNQMAQRIERVRRALDEGRAETGWLRKLQQTHEIALYRFGRDLKPLGLLERLSGSTTNPIDSTVPETTSPNTDTVTEQSLPGDWLEQLRADQDQTRLGDHLGDAIRLETSHPLAGVVVFTDGQANAGNPPASIIPLAKENEVSLFPVGVGTDLPRIDLRLTDLQVPTRAFKGDQFQITAFIQGVGLGAVRVPIELVVEPASGGESVVVEKRELELPASDTPINLNFTYLPEQGGNWRIILRSPALPADRFPENNQLARVVDVVDRQTKLLLFAGGPNRDYQFVRNLAYRDKTIQLSIFLQSGKGAIAQEADTILDAFPSQREALFSYDVILAFDPDWSAVPTAAQTLLVEWVAEQAGGLLVSAGPVHTPRLSRDDTLEQIRQLYPVRLHEQLVSDQILSNDAWPIQFTPEGSTIDYLRLEDDPANSAKRWQEFAGFYYVYPVDRIKPAATVLAEFSDPRAAAGTGVTPPVFASQFFGAGRVFYLGSNEIWRMRRLGEKYFDRLWINVIRHLGQGRLLRGTQRGSILLDSEIFTVGEQIQIRARALNEEFQPLLAESLSISLTLPSNQEESLTLKPEIGKPGWFTSQLIASEQGEYRLQLLLPAATETTERRFLVKIPNLESDETRLNRTLLQRLAERTGGKYLEMDQLEELPTLLPDRTEETIQSSAPQPLWDKSWVLFLAVILFGLEWLIRKLSLLA